VSDSICRRCGRPVVVDAARYETFENMHYVCFYYEFEHDPADPDESARRAAVRPRRFVAGRAAAVGVGDRAAVDDGAGQQLVGAVIEPGHLLAAGPAGQR
jgi:hypothetical protein